MRRETPTQQDARPKRMHLDGALRARGARPTRQRRAIYGALAARFDHPTAEALHRAVLRQVPGLSLATVYTSLEVMAEAGLVGRIVGPDGVARYDARMEAHDHRRCLRCGAIEDLKRPEGLRTLEMHDAPGFRATDYHLEIVGYCAPCLTAGGAPQSTTDPAGIHRNAPKGESE